MKAHGCQCTDSIYVLAVIHGRRHLALIGEFLSAALNEIAVFEPTWLQARVPEQWYHRYARWLVDEDIPDSRRHVGGADPPGYLLGLPPPRDQYEALQQARQYMQSEEGKTLFKQRAGIAGTISQGVRGFGLRQTRDRGLAKTHLQHVATAAAINLDRIVGWLAGKPLEETRISRFAALAAAAGWFRQQYPIAYRFTAFNKTEALPRKESPIGGLVSD